MNATSGNRVQDAADYAEQVGGEIIEPLSSRPPGEDSKKDLYRERYNWLAWLTRQPLTAFQKNVGTVVWQHYDSKDGDCYPSVERIAAWLSCTEYAVTVALRAIYDLGALHYPENRGGKGRSHQFTFIRTADQDVGLAYKPPATVGGLKRAEKRKPPMAVGGSAASADAKPPTAVAQTPYGRCANPQPPRAKPPTAEGGNCLNSRENCCREQGGAVRATLKEEATDKGSKEVRRTELVEGQSKPTLTPEFYADVQKRVLAAMKERV